jgi:hypothetical protein
MAESSSGGQKLDGEDTSGSSFRCNDWNEFDAKQLTCKRKIGEIRNGKDIYK